MDRKFAKWRLILTFQRSSLPPEVVLNDGASFDCEFESNASLECVFSEFTMIPPGDHQKVGSHFDLELWM